MVLPFLRTKARKPRGSARFRMHYPQLGIPLVHPAIRCGTPVIPAGVYLSQAPSRCVRRRVSFGSSVNWVTLLTPELPSPVDLVVGGVSTSFQWFDSRGSCLLNHCGIQNTSAASTERRYGPATGSRGTGYCGMRASACSRAVGKDGRPPGDSLVGQSPWCRW